MSRFSSWLLGSVVFAAGLTASAAAAGPIGALETPSAGQVVSGVIPVSGYVLDFAGVDKVELFVDGAFRSRAQINIPRPDVIALFPQYASSPTHDPGFATSLNTRTLSSGPHLVTIRVTETGNTQTIDIATVSVAVSSANTNGAPFGALDSPSSDGVELSGSFPVTGWAADDSGTIDHIDFLVDGSVVAGAVGTGGVGSARYGLPRPDVFALFPDVSNSFNSGFVANIDTTAFVNGVHTISVRAFDGQGASNVLGVRRVVINNVGPNLAPFGYLDTPLDKASIVCSSANPFVDSASCPEPCFQTSQDGLSVPVSYYKNIVSGWALDVGAREDRGQVSYVEVLIDGEILANSRRDCVRTGKVFANCYGVNRPDVARAYPGYVNADNSGFAFLFTLVPDSGNGLFAIVLPDSLGNPTVGGFTTGGKHTLSIRVGDEKETVTQIAAISVDVVCDSGKFDDTPAIGYIDFPTQGQSVKGVTTFSGWAFDPDNGGQASWVNGIQRIETDIDGQVVGIIFAPLIARADVPANDYRVPATPLTPGPSAFVGWAFTFDSGNYTDGQHDFVVYAVDTANPVTGRPSFRTEIGRRKFTVFNNTGTKK
ncbi:MAG TPA: Ig-like domain-containing protein [Thermoanaerobaculia bacterium]|nr:Ig-like domain-containing protein [Thermoanaerobaculia bacterium]